MPNPNRRTFQGAQETKRPGSRPLFALRDGQVSEIARNEAAHRACPHAYYKRPAGSRSVK